MNRIKKTMSLMIVLALVLAGISVNPTKSNAQELVYGVDYVKAYIRVDPPFGFYWRSFYEFELVKEDLNDDFGIGLPTGDEAKFTVLRGLAKTVREAILKVELGVENPGSPTDEEKAKANELMADHIYVVQTGQGLSLRGLTPRGDRKWNPHVFSEEDEYGSTDFSDGFWSFYVGSSDENVEAM